MEIFRKSEDLNAFLNDIRKKKMIIGFVPTMGALHEGHLSLLHEAKNQSDLTVASIFVNPTQFNDKNDLNNYPRDEKGDINLLEKNGCSIVFIPKVNDIYPNDVSNISYNLGELDTLMEGKYRPGHFNGVAMVVHRLFNIVQPHKAFFGQKDFQQLAVIKHITKSLKLNIEIIGCPTLREEDGLAMSSRNQLLNEKQREHAPVIYEALKQSVDLIKTKGIEKTRQWVIDKINKDPELTVEYYEVVDQKTLKPALNISPNQVLTGCIATFAGNVRLIDNINYIL